MNQNVEAQYKTAKNLNIRSSVHAKYSTNKQPFGDWISEQYQIVPGARILELGCGTGSIWKDKLSLLEPNCSLVLSDFSPGMLDTARKTVGMDPRVDYQVIDIQNIPYQEASFDIVIANMMLYHVPDVAQALREIRRVLKPGGRFLAATFGENGVVQAVAAMLGMRFDTNMRFTLQNGGEQLAAVFRHVERHDREDALDVTDLRDLIAYLRSMQQMTALADVPDEKLLAAFAPHVRDGVLSLPKEYGLFICR